MNKANILRATILFILLFSIGQISKAQIIISEDMFERSSFSIDLQVRDSVTNQPIGFASAYLQHPKDTVITNFALSDAEGKASIKKVTKGQYLLTIEFMGYLPYHKTFYARDEKNLGILKMAPDIKALEAAKVTAAANPIEIKKDTIIYNAAAFKVGQNSTLLDLLKKMPGIEVDDKGNVKVNGQPVSKITVGGKTFFLGDNTAALNNLPAKMVNKVKVIDKDSDAAAFSGIADEKKQKVMDVELKDEYKKGTFGNIKIGAGSTAYGKQNRYLDPRGFLFSDSGMLSIYNEKDQLTMIGSALNVQMSGDGMAFDYSDDDDEGGIQMGLPKNFQFGANYNTDRWKGMESNLSVSLRSNKMNDYSHTDRTTLLENSEDLNSLSTNKADAERNSLRFSGYFNKENTKKYTFSFAPTFYFSDTDINSETNSATTYGSVQKNKSDILTGSTQKYFKTDGKFTLGVKDIGKKRRALTFTGEYVFGGSDGNSTEYSSTYYNALDSTIERNLFFDKNYSNYSVGGSAQYVEPIGQFWAIQTFVSSYYKVRKSDNSANNADGSHNDYYSSNSNNYYFTNYGRLLMQYKKKSTSLQLGGLVRAISNENYARSFGIDTRTGINEWLWNWAPFLRFNTSVNDINFRINYSGNSSRPSQSQIAPTLNIVNPTRISVGNIYLTPSFTHELTFSMSGGNSEMHTSYNIYSNAAINMNESTSARWFDSNSIQYSVPVNSKKDGYTCSINGFYLVPLNNQKNLRLSGYGHFNANVLTSYQSSGILEGLNTDNFDYSSFMSKFWGDSKGDRFYSGASGFKESNTVIYNLYMNAGLYYIGDFLSVRGDVNVERNKSTYSLDSKANVRTWDVSYYLELLCNTTKEWEISTNIGYNTYFGYSEGFNDPNWIWNASVAKSIRGITLKLMADDILNQHKMRSRSAGDNYYEDYYKLSLGRKIMLSVTFNFGKSNAARSQAARQSMWDLAW